ncbi:hypothetical protein NAT51_08295 [Flavobacterium amniphilum]|uniref:HmuY family protein n=1 Tax=Flavobacterium amniphilum TaxID=1834035 RepID=UPI002029DC8D|nr:HmuY family protein [Flavobacterium amniphilum]MCL9805519.1 hypothetical protein [Flavobacterium amniphilum]
MKKAIYFFLSALALGAFSCSEDSNTSDSLGVAFVNQEVNITQSSNQVNVVFSEATKKSGTVTLSIEANGVTYGTDFNTNPVAVNNTITVPFAAGATSATFTFNKLIDATEGQTKNAKFTVTAVTGIDAEFTSPTNTTRLNFNEVPVSSKTISPAVGGNTFPNNVYVDLSSGVTTNVARTSWELGFYSGTDYRVVLNPGINKFAVKQLATTNIDEVQTSDANVTTGNYDPAGAPYIDHPYGNLSGTAIAAISATDADNKVYLVNLGQNVSATPATGSNAALTGTDRGWKKIRILRNGNGYKLLYANIEATTHNEINITKDEAHNFSFVSLLNGALVNAEPLKQKWDINLGTFMNYTQYNGQDVSYYYPDFVTSNTINGTRVYEVLTSEFTYDAFTTANVDANKFNTTAAADRRAIGANWRATYPSASLKTDRFYVVKDAAGNIYKLKFTAMVNGSSERGNITFEYIKL